MQHDFILLDRSASMAALWVEALAAINGYVQKLATDNVDTGVTLATFDTNASGGLAFEVIRDRITPPTWRPVSKADATPRGMTPLNDAAARIVHLARTGNYHRVAIIVMTDGQENASRECSLEAVRALLDDCRGRGWQVIFLGANFDNQAQAMSYGTLGGQTVRSSKRNLCDTMAVAAAARMDYAAAGTDMAFTDEQKDQLKQD